MPATAGKVRMPAGNRQSTSSSLNTHSIWQNAIGYDPYAAESTGADTGANQEAAASARENMKALLALANKNKAGGVDAEEKGGWKGRGTLRGGWAGGGGGPCWPQSRSPLPILGAKTARAPKQRR